MRFLIPILLLVSCTPTIEKMEKRDKTMTDSAMAVLDALPSTYRVDTVSIVKTQTVERIKETVKYVEVESSPVFNAVVRPVMPIERRGCDTVWIRDTVYISR